MLLGIDELKQTPTTRKSPEPKKTKRKVMKCKERRFRSSISDQMFTCLKCSDNIKLSRSMVQNHLRKHRLSLQEYLDKYDLPENRDMLVNIRLWVQNQDYMLQLSGNT